MGQKSMKVIPLTPKQRQLCFHVAEKENFNNTICPITEIVTSHIL